MRTPITITAAIVTVISSALVGCASHSAATKTASARPAPIKQLEAMMVGSFTSTEQSKLDPQNFRDVHLHMTPIWTDRTDGPWLYIEQAIATSLDKPYRQRIYRLSTNLDATLTSAVYKLPGDGTDSVLAFAGAWNNPEIFNGLTPQQLEPLSGCNITLTQQPDGSFTGGTTGTGCASNRQGASYTTSEVAITPAMLKSWDRGFSAEDQQVWGATAGGYQFVKQSN